MAGFGCSMKFLPLVALTALLIALAPGPASALPPTADGITAKIVGGQAGAVFQADLQGNYQFQVTIYEKQGAVWAQVAMAATLRAFVFDAATQVDEDRVSIPFTSKALGPTTVKVPKALIGQNFADVFVTFSELGGDPVPTSHYNLARNRVIDAAQFDAADLLDHTSTQRPFFLG